MHFFSFFLSLGSVHTFAEGVATLPELINPDEIHVDGRQLYVVEGIKIFIYSLEDFKLVASFGKKGEGPREFLKRVILPTGGESYSRLTTIFDNKMYQLVDAEEEWRLEISPIK